MLEVKLPTIWTDGKAQVGRVREEKRREDERRSKKRKPQKKEDPGGNAAKHCVFRMICGSGGLKSRLAKAAGAEPPGQIRDEKLHAVVARSTFPSQNVQSTPCSDHFWKLRCRKSARCCGAKHISNSKCLKAPHVSRHFWTFRCRLAWQVQGIAHLVKSEQNVRVCGISKTMAGEGHLNRICKDAFSMAGAVQETCSSELLGGPGADFLRGLHFGAWDLQVCWDDFAWQVQHFYDLAIAFRGRGSTLDRWSGKIAKLIGTRPSALHATFHFGGSLAELLRFSCCQVQKLRKSRRIATCYMLMLSTSKIEEVSQNSFVFKLADRQIDRQTGRQRERDREIDKIGR